MPAYFFYDLLSFVVISAVISVVYNLARNHLPRPFVVEVLRTFAMLVVGIAACGAILIGISHWI